MVKGLTPIPFADLVRRMRHEVEVSDSIFDLPVRKWHVPANKYDFSALHFTRRAATPVGPAAGPQTQLAQNIVLSWLAGGRIIELKTVQVNDQLDIPRPCIHVPNIGRRKRLLPSCACNALATAQRASARLASYRPLLPLPARCTRMMARGASACQ